MDSVFQQAIARFESRLTDEQRRQLPGCTREDVEQTIADIQAHWGSQRRLRNMNRLSKFIEAMTQLSQVVEVFLNVDSSVAMIWGPIKFLLLIAKTWLHGLEKLLETYADIGEVLPTLKEYHSLFKNHPFVLSSLESYYCDILEFHSIAFDVFARPVWREVFRSSWKTFETRFGPIMNSMRRHEALLSAEKLTAIQAEIQDFRGDVEDHFAAFAKQMKDRDDARAASIMEKEYVSRKRKIAAVLDNLDPPDYWIDQDLAEEQWKSSNSGAWVLKDPSFQEWLESASKNILYLNGIPGAGKSVLVSRMIHYLQQARLDFENNDENRTQTPAFTLVYFYFKHQEPRKRQLTDLLAAVAAQLIQQDDGIIDHVFSECCAGDQSKLRSSRNLLELVRLLVRTQRSCIFVLDGLDECTGNPTKTISDECEKVLDTVLSLFPTAAPGVETNGTQRIFRLTNSPQRSFRLLVSGQRDGFLDHKFEKFPAIHLEKSLAHSHDIDAYAKAMIEKIEENFDGIKEDTISLIFNGVHNESKGMFLYAKIVLNNLLNQVSINGLRRELYTKSFPKGLNEAYERVVASVFDNPEVNRRNAAMDIISFVVVAERPLRWREIQARFCIDATQELSNQGERIQVSCKTLCRSLVDVVGSGSGGKRTNPNDTIHIVHSTALDFLVQTRRISLRVEHARMATFCGNYLGSCCFNPNSNSTALQRAVQTGYLGLHDYALAFWFEHFAHAMEDITALPETDQIGVKMAASKLENACQRHTIGCTETEIAVPDLGVQWLRGLPQDHRDRFLSVPAIASMIKNVRTAIETAQTTGSLVPGEISLDVIYGPPTFKCSKPWCDSYFTGFTNIDQRKKHVQEHDTPFRCEEESCWAYSLGFPTEKNLNRHMQVAHSEKIDLPSKRVKTFPAAPSSGLGMGDLCAAAANGDLVLVKALVKNGADLNASSKAFPQSFPLNLAAKQGHLQVCQFLLQSGAKVNHFASGAHHTALIIASHQGDMDLVSILLDQDDVDVWYYDRDGWTALGYAVSAGHVTTVQVFIARLEKNDLFSNAAGPLSATALSIAIHEGKEEIAQLLLQHLPSDIASQTSCSGIKYPLHSALKRGDEQLAYILAHAMTGKAASQLNEKDLQGMLPLHAAIIGECRNMTTFLLLHTNCVDKKNSEGLTPFQHAIEARDDAAISILLDKYPTIVSNTNAVGQCYIMLSIGKVPRPLVHRMLRFDSARLEGRDEVQASLLHYACYAGDFEAVRILLASNNHDKIDVNATMSSWPARWEAHWPRPEGSIGLNPITCAMVGSKAGTGRGEILRLLLDSGKLKFPNDNHIQLLQTCSSTNDGLTLWRLIHYGLHPFSDSGTSTLDSPTLGEMVSCLLRDQFRAKDAIGLPRVLVNKTLKSCFERLVDAEPHNASAIFLESEALFPEITAFARNRLIRGGTDRTYQILCEAYAGSDVTILQSLLQDGLTIADVARIGGRDILQWALSTETFDINEVNDGTSVFVDACINDWSHVVDLLLKYGPSLEDKHIFDAIDKLKGDSSEETNKKLKLLRLHWRERNPIYR